MARPVRDNLTVMLKASSKFKEVVIYGKTSERNIN